MSGKLSAYHDDLAPLNAARKQRLLNRRLAAAYVGVTIGRFEQLIRQEIVPEAIVVDRNRLWDICALDRVLEAIRQVNEALEPPTVSKQPPSPCASVPGEEGSVRLLPDDAWLQQRSDFVDRVRRSLLSRYEFNLLREFKTQCSDEISMFGFYKTFEALMARGYVMEVSRSLPSSRPLVTYRLTEQGSHIVASMRSN